ncbi:ABC transporter substrate-binding protein [Haloferax chudinovii]|uniref:ABC transporter substrate-binding protein n=1 Tax=Haloferax chudinovii TaxID=1109010 RepID=A0ABD5XJ96_9EURY
MASNECRDSERSVTRRRNVLRAVGGSAVAGLAGCIGGDGGGSGSTPTDGSTTGSVQENGWPDYSGREMRVVTDECSDVFKRVWEDAFAEFENQTGASVTLECGAEGQSIQERIIQLIQSGNPPELFPTSVTQSTQLQNQGTLAPMTDLVETVTDRLGMPHERSFLERDGEHYTIPFFAIPYLQWYREDIAESKPDSWENMVSWMEEASNSDEVTDATLLPWSTHYCSELVAQCFLRSNGANMATRNDDGEVVVSIDQGENRERWIEMLEFRKQLQPYTGPGSDIGCEERINALHTESAAHTTYGGARPKIQSIERDRDFHQHIRAEPIPGPDGPGEFFGVIKSICSFEGSNTDMAKTFLDRFIFQPEYYERYINIQNAPLYPKQKEEIDMREKLPDSYTDEDIAAWKSVTDAIPPAHETSPPNPYVDSIFTTRPGSTAISLVISEDMDPGEAVDQVAESARESLNQAKGP